MTVARRREQGNGSKETGASDAKRSKDEPVGKKGKGKGTEGRAREKRKSESKVK